MNITSSPGQQSTEASLPGVLAGRGLQFLLLTIAAMAGAYARTTVSPLQEAARVALSLSDNQIALLQGPALALPLVIAAIPLGLAVDRYSRVRLLLAFSVLDVAGGLLTALAHTFTILFLARCLAGLMASAISTTAFSLLADLYPPAQRGRASMVVVIGQFAGMSAAFALGGWLLAMGDSAPDSWRSVMLWLTAPLLATIATTLLMREPERTGLRVSNPSPLESYKELWHFRAAIVPLLVGVITAEIAVMALLTWAAPALSRSFALTPDHIGAIMASGLMVSGILGPLIGGMLADLCQRAGGPRRTLLMLATLAFVSAPAGVFALAPATGLASLLLIIFMTAVGAIVVTGTALFTIVVPNELRGLCVALLAGACSLFGVGLAPLTVSLLSGVLGGPAFIGRGLALVCVAASALGAMAFLWGSRHYPARTIAENGP